ncbi:MAG TPA: hypothetical protein DDW36_01575 [Candidatus Magasanikbacteria bacterium]|nr:hypothetical protein [Candidatus Magasanikbacteria bacterium]
MKKILVIAVIVVIALWLFDRRGQEQPAPETPATPNTVGEVTGETPTNEQPTPAEPAEVKPVEIVPVEPIEPAAAEPAEAPAPAAMENSISATGALPRTAEIKKAKIHYFTKGNLELCARDTVALERALDEKYEFAAVATLVELSKPLPQTFIDQGYASAFEPGTRLMNVRVSNEGTATADFNEKLNVNVSRCGKEQRRAQIVNTLKEFPGIKNVVVTVGEEVW